MAWVFQGNPTRFDIDDYLARFATMIYWHTPRYGKEIRIGDRAFIWRSGTHAGAIAIGSIVEEPTPGNAVRHPEALGEALWHGEKPDPGELKTGIRLDELRFSPAENMVPRAIVKEHPLLGSTTLIRAQGTVHKLKHAEAVALEALWGRPPSLLSSPLVEEGELRLRSHYVRERSRYLRAQKVAAYRAEHGFLACELCGHKESGTYPPPLGERIFEVHHHRPLSTAMTSVQTKLEDLAVLCANCHRAVHGSEAVDENYVAIRDVFKQSKNTERPASRRVG